MRLLKEPLSHDKDALIFLSNEIVPGGYIWYFPDGDKTINVGIGVKRSYKNPQLKHRFNAYILPNPIFEGSQLIRQGSGVVPTRKPLNSMVSGGFMCVGDSACQIHPVLGGGIGPSTMGGYLAGKIAVQAISP